VRAGRVKSTDKLPRIYGPNDPRAERGSRLGAVRARRTEEAAEAAQAAAETAVEEVEAGLTFVDFAGTAFPEAPTDGRAFTRTDLDGDMFSWDETRQKWLTVDTTEVTFTNGTTLLAGNSLRLFQGPAGSGTLGDKLLWDATLIAVRATRATSGADTRFDVRAATTIRHSHTLGAAAVTSNEPALDVDFSENEVVNVILFSDMAGGGTCTVIFKRRAS
jgi:hypothetical protein